jgi:hypothetical protein
MIYVARLWVDYLNYQSNTVILAELVLRGRPQPVHKACHESDRLFCFKAATGACLIERESMKKAKATHRVALRSFG